MAITTSMATSFKQELMQGAHCFNGVVVTTGSSSSSTSFTSVGTLVGVSVGMAVTGTNIPANTVVAAITGPAAFTASNAATGTISGGTITFTGDTFKMALVKIASGLTYDQNVTNYSFMATDEVANGSGYATGGTALTNVTPTISVTTAITNFSPNPTWTTASFSTIGCMIYNNGNLVNSSARLGGTSGTNSTGLNRTCGVFDFGGTQTVSSGTFTVVMPTANSSSAILRIA